MRKQIFTALLSTVLLSLNAAASEEDRIRAECVKAGEAKTATDLLEERHEQDWESYLANPKSDADREIIIKILEQLRKNFHSHTVESRKLSPEELMPQCASTLGSIKGLIALLGLEREREWGLRDIAMRTFLENASLTLNYGKTNQDDTTSEIPTTLDKTERQRGWTIGFKGKPILKHSLGTVLLMMDNGIAPTKEGKEWLDVIVWDAVRFDLNYGRKKTRDLVGTTRNDPESRRVREWKLSYQFDVLNATCLLSEKWRLKSCE